MQNSSFRASHRILSNTYKVTFYNGAIKVYTDKDFFLKTITEEELHKQYEVIRKVPAKNKYTVKWYVGGKEMAMNHIVGSYSLCTSKVNQMKNSTHKIGLLQVVSIA